MRSQRLSNKICPDNMTIEEWQIALRRENAICSKFEVRHLDSNRIWGDYSVSSGDSSYKVAFRGVQSDRNYCSCLDFRTNGLGTCKHIESVTVYLQEKVPGYPWGGMDYNAEYTSIYVSYKGGRTIKIRVGKTFDKEYLQLKKEYFNEDNTLSKDKYYLFDEIYEKAYNISSTVRVYDDVRELVKNTLLEQKWQIELENTYQERLIPWNKQNSNIELNEVERYLYNITEKQNGLIICKDRIKLTHFIIRLCEEIYQGEEETLRGYIILDSPQDISRYKSTIALYNEARTLPINIVTSEEFITECSNSSDIITFLYIDDSLVLKEWKNPLSILLKKLRIKHLYMHLDTLMVVSPVQLSSILQHISPFIIGPFYRFIHSYRPLFPLEDNMQALPQELKEITFILNDALSNTELEKFADVNTLNINNSTTLVKNFIYSLKELINDPNAVKILQQKLQDI